LPTIISNPLIKTSFHFSCYTKKRPAILLLFADILRQRMFIADGVK